MLINSRNFSGILIIFSYFKDNIALFLQNKIN